MKKKIIVLLLVVAISIASFFAYRYYEENQVSELYLASDTNELVVYDENLMTTNLVRGKKVLAKNNYQNIDGQDYRHVEVDGKVYYVLDANLVDNLKDCVLEDKMYIKTTSSLLEMDSANIVGLLNKGDEVDIIGYNDLLADGSVKMYHVRHNDLEGRVYAKYLSSDLSAEDNTYLDIHKSREDLYGGGDAYSLEYSYEEKMIFEDNVMPEVCNTLYINGSSISHIDDYIDFALNNNINAFVIDIKDSHIPTYQAEAMKKYSPTAYDNALMTAEEFKNQISKVKEAGIYLIGRITAFKDTNYAIDHPDDAIFDKTENASLYYNSSYWPSAYKRNVWVYNVELAKEAVLDYGFNEIQFDYVRFPDRIGLMESNGEIDLLNVYGETKAQAVQRFIMYAADELHSINAYISVDVFGETSNAYVTAYGQYWPAISNYVDVISAMPYPDHFNIHDYGIEEAVWEVPYKLLDIWSKDVQARQSETPSKAKVRTWIQGYDSIKEPYVEYDSGKIKEQIDALFDNGLNDGFIVWNGASSLEKYQSFSEAFNSLDD